jgi:DNA-binding transcriptional ArsR family regulator
MQNSKIEFNPAARLSTLKALASPLRLAVLEYLKDPAANFPPQVDGDFVTDGVCADFLRAKLGIAAATASRHLTLLADAGLVVATRKKGWTFYRRNEDALARFTAELVHGL